MYKFRSNIEEISPYKPGKPIKEVERELGIKNSLKLASNENAWGFSPLCMKAMQEAIKEANMYPDGNSFYLRNKIADFNNNVEKNNIELENINAGNGSNEVLEVIMRTVLSDGYNVVSSQYAFAIYKLISQCCGAEYIATPSKNYAFDTKAIMSACDEKTAIIVIDNPNNPTGTYIPYEKMIELVEFAEKKGILLICDEAYVEYVRAKDYKTMMSVCHKYKNLVVTRTFSKAYGLCGLRLGYAVAAKKVIDLANKVRAPFNVNIVAQHTGLAALDDQDFVKETVKKTHEGIDYFYDEFKKLGLNYIETQCNFMLLELADCGVKFFENLLKKGVIVRPMAGYGLQNFIRISVGTMEQNKLAIEAIKFVLAKKD
jgi:histidinol-phosphate aminotransferase